MELEKPVEPVTFRSELADPAPLLLAISFAVLVLVHALQRSPLLRWNGR